MVKKLQKLSSDKEKPGASSRAPSKDSASKSGWPAWALCQGPRKKGNKGVRGPGEGLSLQRKTQAVAEEITKPPAA